MKTNEDKEIKLDEIESRILKELQEAHWNIIRCNKCISHKKIMLELERRIKNDKKNTKTT